MTLASMSARELALICDEYLPAYEANGVAISQDELLQLTQKAADKAMENYPKLSEPKTGSLSTYTAHWVREAILKDFTSRTTKRVSSQSADPLARATAEFLAVFPPEVLYRLRAEIYNSQPYAKREQVWQSYHLPLEEIEARFVALVTARNVFANQQGYSSYLALALKNNKIPLSAYQRFVRNVDRLIRYCHRQLPEVPIPAQVYSEFTLPCFICQIPLVVGEPDEVMDIVARQFPVLEKFRGKVQVNRGDASQTLYEKETDSFRVTLNRQINGRHQSLDLIHELGHVISQLQTFSRGSDPLKGGKYQAEKSALENALVVMNGLSPLLFGAYLGEVLLLFHRALFEIELYTRPTRNLGQVYAQGFNRCFPKAQQTTNPTYLLDERITLSPLSSLPHVVAHATVLFGLMSPQTH